MDANRMVERRVKKKTKKHKIDCVLVSMHDSCIIRVHTKTLNKRMNESLEWIVDSFMIDHDSGSRANDNQYWTW